MTSPHNEIPPWLNAGVPEGVPEASSASGGAPPDNPALGGPCPHGYGPGGTKLGRCGTCDWPAAEFEPEVELPGANGVTVADPATAGAPEAPEAPDAEITIARILAANAADEVLLSDRGCGRRFAEMYAPLVRYVIDRDEWLVRTGAHWDVDAAKLLVFGLTAGVTRAIRADALRPLEGEDAEERRDRMLGYALKTESEATRWRIVSSAREHPELIATEDDLDARLNEIATPSGVVDLLTGELRAARPGDLCTRAVTAEYDPDATSPLLDQYLDTFVPEPEDQRVLFAALGTMLRGGNPTRLFPVILGGTTSGKSQLISALDRLLGRYICTVNASVFRGNLDDKPRPDIVRAMYHRIAYASEASASWELHADQAKRLTGGEAVPYRNLYGQIVEKVPRFTPLIITNRMPRVKGADPAFRRRMLTLSFDRTLPPDQEDARIKERFIADDQTQRALLARIVAGARDELLRDGIRWSLLPQRYAEATLESFDQLDHVSEFIEWLRDRGTLEVADGTDVAETPVSHFAKAGDLHEWYTLWIKKHGDRQDKTEALNLRDFCQALRDRGWTSRRSGGIRWVGVRLLQAPGLWST